MIISQSILHSLFIRAQKNYGLLYSTVGPIFGLGLQIPLKIRCNGWWSKYSAQKKVAMEHTFRPTGVASNKADSGPKRMIILWILKSRPKIPWILKSKFILRFFCALHSTKQMANARFLCNSSDSKVLILILE